MVMAHCSVALQTLDGRSVTVFCATKYYFLVNYWAVVVAGDLQPRRSSAESARLDLARPKSNALLTHSFFH